MTRIASAIPATLDALVDLLQARPALTGLQITSAALNLDHTEPESIQLIEVESEAGWAGMGRRTRDEAFTIKGALWVLRHDAGEAVVRGARDRAYALLDEVGACVHEDLRGSPGGTPGVTIVTAQLARHTLKQLIHGDGGRSEIVEFEIDVTARLTAP